MPTTWVWVKQSRRYHLFSTLKTANGSIKSPGGLPYNLMYNWENEIKKFTQSLTYYIHHGGTSDKNNGFAS